MTLKYFQAQINNFVNNTDEMVVLVGYEGFINQPLTSGQNYWQIFVTVNGKDIDSVGENVVDNGLTRTYVQLSAGTFYRKHLLIPPGGLVSSSTSNGVVSIFGQFIQGTLEEVAQLL